MAADKVPKSSRTVRARCGYGEGMAGLAPAPGTENRAPGQPGQAGGAAAAGARTWNGKGQWEPGLGNGNRERERLRSAVSAPFCLRARPRRGPGSLRGVETEDGRTDGHRATSPIPSPAFPAAVKTPGLNPGVGRGDSLIPRPPGRGTFGLHLLRDFPLQPAGSSQNVPSPARLRKDPRANPWDPHEFPMSYKYPGKRNRLSLWDLPRQRLPMGIAEVSSRMNSGKFTQKFTWHLGKEAAEAAPGTGVTPEMTPGDTRGHWVPLSLLHPGVSSRAQAGLWDPDRGDLSVCRRSGAGCPLLSLPVPSLPSRVGGSRWHRAGPGAILKPRRVGLGSSRNLAPGSFPAFFGKRWGGMAVPGTRPQVPKPAAGDGISVPLPCPGQ